MRKASVASFAFVLFSIANSVFAQPTADSPRRTRNVEIIERSRTSIVAIFSQVKDNAWNAGSGSVIHPAGYILTNEHVIGEKGGLVLFNEGPPLRYRNIGRLKEKDLALIKVDPPGQLVALKLGRSDDLVAGEPILIGGNPGGRGIVFSAGMVSSPSIMMDAGSALAMTTQFPDDARYRFIQFDAACNPGNSGGPLLNAEGLQIGVVSAKNFQEQSISYAIPIDRAHQVLHDLLLPEERGDFQVGLCSNLALLRSAE